MDNNNAHDHDPRAAAIAAVASILAIIPAEYRELFETAKRLEESYLAPPAKGAIRLQAVFATGNGSKRKTNFLYATVNGATRGCAASEEFLRWLIEQEVATECKTLKDLMTNGREQGGS